MKTMLSKEETGLMKNYISRVTGNWDFRLCENKDADQIRSNCEADQRHCFRYTERTIALLPKSEISRF